MQSVKGECFSTTLDCYVIYNEMNPIMIQYMVKLTAFGVVHVICDAEDLSISQGEPPSLTVTSGPKPVPVRVSFVPPVDE